VDADQPAEAQRERLGDRLEQAIEQHADLPGEVARGEQELDAAPAQARRSAIRRTVFWLVVSGVSLYLVAPSIIETFSSWEQIQQLSPAWLAAMAGLQAAALACVWALQRVSIPGSRWQPIIAAHLTSNALAKIVPGGSPMASALQYRMLVAAGLTPAAIVSGLTAASLLVFAVMLALPLLAIPSILRGGVQHDLLNAAVVGLIVFVLLFALGAVLLTTDGLLLWVGRTVQRIRNRLRRRAAPLEQLPQRLIGERDRIIDTLGPRWKRALAAALARWGFDFGCLLAALKALDALGRPGLVPAGVLLRAAAVADPCDAGRPRLRRGRPDRDARAGGCARGRRGRGDVRVPAVRLLAPATVRAARARPQRAAGQDPRAAGQ
jgi:hypothetical protein